MAEERFTSQYDGTTQDNLLKFAENVKKATTVDGAETVNVQGFTLPRISDISGFVAVNNAGNAIGFMSKEQVASVLGGLIGTVVFKSIGRKEELDHGLTSTQRLMVMFVTGYMQNVTPSGANYICGFATRFSSLNTEMQVVTDYSGNQYSRILNLSNGDVGAWR